MFIALSGRRHRHRKHSAGCWKAPELATTIRNLAATIRPGLVARIPPGWPDAGAAARPCTAHGTGRCSAGGLVMRLIQIVVLVTALSCAAHAGARDHTRYMNVVNRAHDSVTSLAIA